MKKLSFLVKLFAYEKQLHFKRKTIETKETNHRFSAQLFSKRSGLKIKIKNLPCF